MMSSSIVMVYTMVFVLACLAATPATSAASGDDGGILYIPSTASIAHCPSSCGSVVISYPFGIGAGCFRQGFELTCDNTTQPPKLFLGNSTIQITGMYDSSVLIPPIFFNSSLEESGTNTYNISWDALAKGITISSDNSFLFVGCDFDVILFDSVRNPIGSCASRCHGKVSPDKGPCNGFGCCSIHLQNDISGFQGAIVRASNMATQSLHPGIMAFMLEEGEYGTDLFSSYGTDLFSSWTNAGKIYDDVLEVAIMDQPSCKIAQMNKASYACGGINSVCRNASQGGYACYCSNNNYNYGTNVNPYLSEGCRQDYYNTKPKEQCKRLCGNMTIPFPFGLEEDCYGNERFQLNCTASNTTLFTSGPAQYRVLNVSLEDGTLIVSNILNNNASSVKEVIIDTNEQGYYGAPVEDQFDFSMGYDIVIRWVVTNSTCQQAKQNSCNYACLSINSSCLNVTHGDILMGYRCNCSSGFQGNPYIHDGCAEQLHHSYPKPNEN